MSLGECVCMFLCVGGFVYFCSVYKRCEYICVRVCERESGGEIGGYW